MDGGGRHQAAQTHRDSTTGCAGARWLRPAAHVRHRAIPAAYIGRNRPLHPRVCGKRKWWGLRARMPRAMPARCSACSAVWACALPSAPSTCCRLRWRCLALSRACSRPTRWRTRRFIATPFINNKQTHASHCHVRGAMGGGGTEGDDTKQRKPTVSQPRGAPVPVGFDRQRTSATVP